MLATPDQIHCAVICFYCIRCLSPINLTYVRFCVIVEIVERDRENAIEGTTTELCLAELIILSIRVRLSNYVVSLCPNFAADNKKPQRKEKKNKRTRAIVSTRRQLSESYRAVFDGYRTLPNYSTWADPGIDLRGAKNTFKNTVNYWAKNKVAQRTSVPWIRLSR